MINLRTLAQQREYTFNQPGNECYMSYICFAPDTDYLNVKRPFIFILGKGNQSAFQVFSEDTLRNSKQFYHYQFVYIPNKGETPRQKLNCVESLASLVTHNFQYGHINVFFNVNDRDLERKDLIDMGLKSVFKSAILRSEIKDSLSSNQLTDNVFSEFKETEIKDLSKKPKEDIGVYYSEENKDNESGTDSTETKARKIYFGPPSALNYTLTGQVRDKSTGEALPFANVIVKGTTIGTSTNTDGYFTLLKVPTDTSTLIVQYIGYEKAESYLTPATPKKNYIIEVRSQSQNLQNVTVTAHRDEVVFVKKAEVSTIKMTPKKLEMLPSMGEKDILRSFQLMPGVSASNESSSGLYVRGGTPDQNLVLYDGFTVYHVDHLYGFYSAFNYNALKDVQLYKGGFESRFGGRISSVTEITSKEGNSKNINLGGDLSLLSMNIFAEIPVGDKITSFFAFRKSYQGGLYDLIFKKFNTRPSTAATESPDGGRRFFQNQEVTSYFYDLNGKITYKPSERDIISLSIFNGIDKLDNSSASSFSGFGGSGFGGLGLNSTDLTKYGNVGSSLKWSRKWSPKLYGNTILSYSNYFSRRDRSQDRTLFGQNNTSSTSRNGILEHNDIKDYSLRSDYQLDIAEFSQVQFGAFTTMFDVKYSYGQSDTLNILDKNGKAYLGGIYLQDKLKFFNDKLEILPGLRTSYFASTGKMYLEPRASVSYNLTEKIQIKAAYGKYYQFANRVTREDILSGSRDFWILADGKSVPTSSAVHYITGVSYESTNYVLSIEGYYKFINNLTEYSLRVNPSPLGIKYNENFFNGYGYARGLEFLIQKNSGNFNGWVSYSLGEARNHFDAYSDGYYPANQDVTHEFKIVGLYKLRRWDFSANWIFATGRPYTSPSGAYSVTLLDGNTQDFFTVTSKNSLRMPDYHRLDVSASYKLLMGRRGDLKRRELGNISFSLFNIYNRQNLWYKEYTIVESNVIVSNISYLGITPNLTISLKIR